jgi:hypothetical protein
MLGSLHCIKIARSSASISHLLFADDVMIFFRANNAEASAILNCLNTYSHWSRQCINFSKSTVFYSKNCKPNIKASINCILRLPHILARAKYLGLPLFFDRKKSASFVDLKERIFAKVIGWKARLLS